MMQLRQFPYVRKFLPVTVAHIGQPPLTSSKVRFPVWISNSLICIRMVLSNETTWDHCYYTILAFFISFFT